MTLDDLRNLDLKDVGNWAWGPKIGLLAMLLLTILFLAFWFDWKDQLETLDQEQQKEAQLKEVFIGKKRQAVNLEVYREQLREIERAFGALLRQLPNRSEMEALLSDINQAGLGRGLQFELFKPAPQERMAEFYAELPITIRVTGSYHDLGAFASDVAHLPRIVTLNDINITAGTKDGLVMEATAKTFRYLDEEEIRQQRAAREKEQGAKK